MILILLVALLAIPVSGAILGFAGMIASDWFNLPLEVHGFLWWWITGMIVSFVIAAVKAALK